MSLKLIFFLLAALFFAAAAFNIRSNTFNPRWEYLAAACLVVALWIL